jgi:hypothetical protein
MLRRTDWSCAEWDAVGWWVESDVGEGRIKEEAGTTKREIGTWGRTEEGLSDGRVNDVGIAGGEGEEGGGRRAEDGKARRWGDGKMAVVREEEERERNFGRAFLILLLSVEG